MHSTTVLTYKMAIVLRPQICDVISPYALLQFLWYLQSTRWTSGDIKWNPVVHHIQKTLQSKGRDSKNSLWPVGQERTEPLNRLPTDTVRQLESRQEHLVVNGIKGSTSSRPSNVTFWLYLASRMSKMPFNTAVSVEQAWRNADWTEGSRLQVLLDFLSYSTMILSIILETKVKLDIGR